MQDKLNQNSSLEIRSISERVTVEGIAVVNITNASVVTVLDSPFVRIFQ